MSEVANSVPKGWTNKSVKELCVLGRGRVISIEHMTRHEGIYPVYSSQSQNNGEIGRIDSYDFEGEYVTWTTDGAYAGTVFYREGKFNCTNVCGTLKPRDPSTSARYLSYLLSISTKKHVSYVGNPKLMNNVMGNIQLILPSDPAEQRAIADILSTVDEAIAQSESLVRKYQSIKQGLMSDLLTRGVDENGELRPSYEEAPKLYKETKIGCVPEEWDVDYLVHRIDFPNGQIDPRRQPYRNQILIAPDHIEQRTGRVIKLATAEEQNAISGKYPFEKGDVLYSKIRPYLRKAALAEFNGICSADVYPLRPHSNLISKYLLAVLLSEPFSIFATAFSFRSGFPKINRVEMAEFITAFPKPEEQERICNILDEVDKTIETEELSLRKLQVVKQGLMQDLLSGQVRVKV